LAEIGRQDRWSDQQWARHGQTFQPYFESVTSRDAAAAFDELQNEWRQDQLHRKIELAAGDHDRIGTRHKAVGEHRQEISEIDATRLLETDDNHGFVRCRNPASNE